MDFKRYLNQNKILTLAVSVALLISLMHIFFCADVFNDVAGSYGPLAKAFGRCDWEKAFPENVPPLMPALGGILCMAGLDAFPALLIVSCLFFILAIFPLYGFLKLYFKPEHAALGCLLYVVSPKIIRFSCTGLPESARNFFLISAVWLLLSYFRKNAAWKLPLLALCVSGLALVRAEGAIYLPLFLIWFVIMHFHAGSRALPWFKNISSLFVKLAAILILVLIIVSPRMYQVYNLTGIPAIDSRQSDTITGLMDFILPVNESDDAVVLPPGARTQHMALARVAALLECFCAGSYELYLALAVVGVLLLRKRKQITLEHWVIFSFVACNALIFFVIVMSERFFNVNSLLLMPFTVTACLMIYDFLCSKGMRHIAVALLVVAATAQVCAGSNNALSFKQNYRSKVGGWILTEQVNLIRETGKNDGERKIIILSDRPQYAFWADAEWAKSTGNKGQDIPPLEVLQAQNVDIAVVEKENSPLFMQISKSPHFKQIMQPFYKHTGIFLFIPDISASDYVPADDARDDKNNVGSVSVTAQPAKQ